MHFYYIIVYSYQLIGISCILLVSEEYISWKEHLLFFAFRKVWNQLKIKLVLSIMHNNVSFSPSSHLFLLKQTNKPYIMIIRALFYLAFALVICTLDHRNAGLGMSNPSCVK